MNDVNRVKKKFEISEHNRYFQFEPNLLNVIEWVLDFKMTIPQGIVCWVQQKLETEKKWSHKSV